MDEILQLYEGIILKASKDLIRMQSDSSKYCRAEIREKRAWLKTVKRMYDWLFFEQANSEAETMIKTIEHGWDTGSK